MRFWLPACVHQIPGRAGWELRLVVQGGPRILDKIATLNAHSASAHAALVGCTGDAVAAVWM